MSWISKGYKRKIKRAALRELNDPDVRQRMILYVGKMKGTLSVIEPFKKIPNDQIADLVLECAKWLVEQII